MKTSDIGFVQYHAQYRYKVRYFHREHRSLSLKFIVVAVVAIAVVVVVVVSKT